MSVKRNTIANYAGQFYMLAIGMVITPLYLQYLGSAAFGLVSFFTLMQAWMTLLDMGLSPTLGRQVAYARGEGNGFVFFSKILKSFEVIFISLSLMAVATIFVLSDTIAKNWINTKEIELGSISYCIILMGWVIGLRFFSGLYRSGISGLEKQVWLNIINVFMVSIKFIGALILLSYVSTDVELFFEYQLFVGLIEAVILFIFFYRELPLTVNKTRLIYFDWEAVKSVAPYSVGVAYTAGIWILITQTDKLVLSTVLTLSEFGYFSLIGLIAGAITMLSGPIAQALMPRLTILIAQNKKKEMLNIYSLGSQITVLFSFSLALMIGLYAEPLIFAWTGEVEPAEWGADILIWFALGNGVLSVGAFQYYLQSAFGQLRLHVLGSTISAVIQVPLIYYAATEYGAAGAGIAWFSFRCVWFLVWTPLVHRQFVPGFHLKWLFQDILPIIVTVVIVAFMLYVNFGLADRQNRMVLLVQMLTLGVSLVAISSLSVSVVRKIIIEKLLLIFRLNDGSS